MNLRHDGNQTSDKQLSEMKRSDLRQFIFIVSIIFVLGLLGIFGAYLVKHEGHIGDREFWHFLLLEIGIALITACVIAGTVEVFMRNRGERTHEQHKLEIAESVFKALFATAIPNELVGEMYTALFVPKFVREEIEISYRFERLKAKSVLPLDAQKLRVRQQISFQARNVTDTTVSHSSGPREDILIEDPDNPDTPFKEFVMEIVGSDNTSDPRHKIHLHEAAELSAATDKVGSRYQLKQQKLNVGPGQAVRVVLVIEKLCRYADTDTWITSYAANGLRLRVELVGDPPPQLDFLVDQAHRQKLVPVPGSQRTNALSYEWRLNAPILRHQGVMLRWRPKRGTAPISAMNGSGCSE